MKILYSNDLQMKFNKMELKDSGLYIAAFEKQFGEQNVRFNTNTRYFEIYSLKTAIANSIGLKNWKFLVLDSNQRTFTGKVIPKDILEKISWLE